MKPRRSFKPKNAGCPQWILDGVKQKYLEATGRPEPTVNQPEAAQTQMEETPDEK